MQPSIDSQHKYSALACDKDGTLTKGNVLSHRTRKALDRFRAGGGKLILATGESVQQLSKFADLGRFDLAVAENGAVLYWPSTKRTKLIAKKRPAKLVQRLREHGIKLHTVGEVIVSAQPPNDQRLAETLPKLNVHWSAIQNRNEVMALPKGIDKSTGLAEGLKEMGLRVDLVVGVGDAENDLSLLKSCGLGVAVGSAVKSLKEGADLLLKDGCGDGVVELVERLLAGELPAPHRLHAPRRSER